MIGSVRALRRDQRGAAMIEMGFALPILGLMLLGIVDLSRGYAAKLRLEQAAQSTIETVQQRGYQHSTTSTPTSLGAIETEAETRAGTGSDATAAAYIECRNGSNTKTTVAWTSSCPSGQTASRYVSVSISQPYDPLFAFRFKGAEANGNYTLVGQSALRVQ